MFKLTAITKLFITATLALQLTAGCADDSTDPERRDIGDDGQAVPAETVDPGLCSAACDVLFGDCGNAAQDEEPGFDARAVAACRASCRDGLFDSDKLECIATTACGEPIDCAD